MASVMDQINIGILSLVRDETIATQLMPLLRTRKTKPEFIQIEPNDLLDFSPPSYLHAVILLHPFTEGGLSLTDVTNARYSGLLPTLSKRFGSHRICVIAYQVRNVKEHTQQTHLDMLKVMQPTVLKTSAYIIICGQLKDMFPCDLDKIEQFMKMSWTETTKTHWKDEWFTKPDILEDTRRLLNNDAQINHSQRPTTEETTHHTQHGGHDLNETTNVVLVTDASGFIGSHIVQQLIQQGYKVRGALDMNEGTLDSFEKGTLDNTEIQAKVAMLKALFPKLDLFEAGIRYYFGWMRAVQGCTHVIHTSRFHDTKPATEEDVTKLLEVCQLVGGIKRVVLTGSSESIPEKELSYNEWKNTNSALKDAICKDVSEKAALRFIKHQREKLTFGLSIIKPSVVLGPILCELAEAKVEIIRRRMVNPMTGLNDFSIPICDVRDVAEAHIMALNLQDAEDISIGVVPQRLTLKEIGCILKREFKDQGYYFVSWMFRWDNMTRCLSYLYGNIPKSGKPMAEHVLVNDPIDKEKSVIDMAYSCIERGFIQKMPEYKPREQGNRYREETTGASAVRGADNADV